LAAKATLREREQEKEEKKKKKKKKRERARERKGGRERASARDEEEHRVKRPSVRDPSLPFPPRASNGPSSSLKDTFFMDGANKF